MATVTKPIALNESLNTTEVTPRNIADVLAQELEGIAQALTPVQPSASGVSYDNTASGLAADDVQDAIDELADEKANTADLAAVATSGSYNDLTNKPTIPTVNDGTLTIKKNGETIQTFSANQSANATANIPGDTEVITDTEPYVLRQGKGDLVDMEIVGASVAWNQLVQNGNFADTSNWTINGGAVIGASDNVLTITANSVSDGVFQSVPIKIDHKYLQTLEIKNTGACRYGIGELSDSERITITDAHSSFTRFSSIHVGLTSTSRAFAIYSNVATNTIETKNVNIIDLTASLGTTIADYIYSLEQNNAGDGVAWFRQYFPNAYYGYDPGSIQSVCVSGRKVVGFNQWDEEWEVGTYNTDGSPKVYANGIRSRNTKPIHIIGGQSYYFRKEVSAYLFFYDSGDNFISSVTLNASTRIFTVPSGAYYLRFAIASAYGTTYKNDICINISDTSKNGTYEPYTSTTYSLDSSKELRGLFQLVNGKLKAYGDVYANGGNITRKFGVVDLGTLTWTYESTADHERIRSTDALSTLNGADSNTSYGNILCLKYVTVTASNTYQHTAIGIAISPDKYLYVYDPTYTDAATFKTAMNGVYLLAELATPTTESANAYQNPQRAYSDGTEEFIDYGVSQSTRDVAIPVGNNSNYTTNEVIQPIADYVDNIPLACKKTTAGTYTLTATVDANGNVSYAWA